MSSAAPVMISSSPSIRSSPVPLRKPSPRQGSSKPSGSTSGDKPGYKFFEEIHRRSSAPVACHAYAPATSPVYTAPPALASSAPAVGFSFANVTVGFDTKQPSNGPQAPPPRSKPSKGLLSQAFSAGGATGAGELFSFPTPPIKDCTVRPYYALDNYTAPTFSDVPMELLHAAQAKHEVFKTELVKNAYDLAARAHRGQMRQNGDPVLAHCVETAVILADLGLGEELVAAGLLHDVLHDTKFNKYQLEEYMPTDVVRMVETVTKVSKFSQSYRNGNDGNAEKLVQTYTFLHDPKSVFVKLADRLHNMRTIAALPRATQIRMAEETLEVFTVLANRLGLWSLKAELEDLSFQVLHPQEFQELQEKVGERRRAASLEASVNKLKEHLHARGIQVEDIAGRSKNLYGIYKKMVKDGLTLDQVFDVCAVRVIVTTKDECYLARREVFNLWRAIPARSKDFIRTKKENGYQSLHETVIDSETGLPFEVQIRTHKMHFMAEYGLSAHWRYKEDSAADPACAKGECSHMEQLIKWQRWLATCKFGILDKKVRPVGSPAKDMSMASLGLQHIDAAHADTQMDPLLRNERFRLRPVSEHAFPVCIMLAEVGQSASHIFQLPAGSTVADLLRSQQMAASNVCARVNGVEVSDLSRVLQMGDEVELLPPRSSAPRISSGVPKLPFSDGGSARILEPALVA